MLNWERVSAVCRFDALEAAVTAAASRTVLFADPEFRQVLFERLDALLADRSVLCIDVFDTLLLRDGSSELTRFFEIGGMIAAHVDAQAGAEARAVPVEPVDGFLARHLGTLASYRASERVENCREGSLVEIHRTASRLLAGSERHAEAFIEIELAYEAGRLAPAALLLDYVLRHKRERGGQVALVSDMYMHTCHIETLLRRLDVDPALFDVIVSSAETKLSKASGGVFALVETTLAAPASAFVHVGDSLLGDFANPIRRGWRALHLPIPEAEIAARRADHIATAEHLKRTHGIGVDIAMPH